MESKKDIGKLFREKLEQLDYTPSTKVWEQIELDFEEKKKKRRFFIWFFFSTLLTCGLVIGISYTTFSDKNSTTDKEVKENSITTEKTSKNNKTIIVEEEIIADSISKNAIENKNSNATEVDKENSNTLLNINTKKNMVGSKNKPRTSDSDKAKQIGNKNKLNQKLAVASTSFKNKRKSTNNNATLGKKSSKKVPKNSAKFITDTKKSDSEEKLLTSDAITNTTENSVIESIPIIDSLIASTTNKKENKNPKKEKDSLAVKDSVVEVQEESKGHEIVIAPYYGINYGGYFGNFDAISSNTVLEKKEEMRNTYGIIARWMFGNKLGIQIGAGKINSRYISTVEKTGSYFINDLNVATDIPINDLNSLFVNETKVKFTYESSYIEVPLEAYYVLRDKKKLGFATSFGVSLLFGGKNSVFAESENVQKLRIGTLTTASPSSFTGNGKVYLFYKITPSLQLDLYPSFQCQILGNTDSSNYSGYFFSVRTGFSYKL